MVCERCKLEITRDKLGLAKFVRDITIDVKNPADPSIGYGVYLACASSFSRFSLGSHADGAG